MDFSNPHPWSLYHTLCICSLGSHHIYLPPYWLPPWSADGDSHTQLDTMVSWWGQSHSTGHSGQLMVTVTLNWTQWSADGDSHTQWGTMVSWWGSYTQLDTMINWWWTVTLNRMQWSDSGKWASYTKLDTTGTKWKVRANYLCPHFVTSLGNIVRFGNSYDLYPTGILKNI